NRVDQLFGTWPLAPPECSPEPHLKRQRHEHPVHAFVDGEAVANSPSHKRNYKYHPKNIPTLDHFIWQRWTCKQSLRVAIPHRLKNNGADFREFVIELII